MSSWPLPMRIYQIKKTVMVKLICFEAIKPIFYLITIKVLLILDKFVFIYRGLLSI